MNDEKIEIIPENSAQEVSSPDPEKRRSFRWL